MSEADDFERAADALCDVIIAIDDVDLNALGTDDDVRALLDAKDTIEEMCLRHRGDQHAGRDR